MFSGRDCATAAGRPKFGGDYEGQLLGSDVVGVGDPTGAAPAETQHQGEWMAPDDGAVGGTVGGAPLPIGLDQFCEERVSGRFRIE